ncbi:MAG TPA: phytoene desaturase [Sandaracinaceae bacterium LLY-WYZ-13_1]|nr:phytoene desaturase [Sandaracinaceae bacterium LLY-WYZ-13_1]
MAVLPHLKGTASPLPLGADASWRQALDAAVRSFLQPEDRLRTDGAPVPVTHDSPRAVVIGAGLGGLAAAVRLGARGYRVTVIDKLDQPGGRARVFRDDGFVFDAGPTVITAPFMLEELWRLAGKRLEDDVELREVSPFYRIRFHDGSSFDYTGSAEAMRREIARFAPSDLAGYERFLEHSERIFEIGFEQLAHVPFDTAVDMARIVPAMLRLENYRTVHDLVAKYVKDERLRQVFSFHPLLVGGNPYSCSSIYTLIAFLERKWKVWFAMGGTGEIVRGLVKLIEGLGGEVQLGREVTEIRVEKGRATGLRFADGTSRPADVVVSNADSAWTYRHLIAPEHRRHWPNWRLERSRYSMSLFVWYFGTDRRYEDVAHHTILLGPRYEALLKDIFDRKVLAEDFSLYLHRPTATDPSMAPDGCDAFYVLSPVPHLDSGVDWRRRAEPYRRTIERYLSDTIMPGLEDHVVTSRMLTPQGFLDDYLSLKGAAFGLEPVLHQSAYFRPHNRSEDVEGLYLVGAGTHPGAGMPGVLSSARVLDTVVPDVVESRTG